MDREYFEELEMIRNLDKKGYFQMIHSLTPHSSEAELNSLKEIFPEVVADIKSSLRIGCSLDFI